MAKVKEKNVEKKVTTKQMGEVKTPELVNEKNEVIYDGEKELETLLAENMTETKFEMPEALKEAIEAVKDEKEFNDMPENNFEEMHDKINEKIEQLEHIAGKLEKDITERMNKIVNDTKPKKSFTSFWNGIAEN